MAQLSLVTHVVVRLYAYMLLTSSRQNHDDFLYEPTFIILHFPWVFCRHELFHQFPWWRMCPAQLWPERSRPEILPFQDDEDMRTVVIFFTNNERSASPHNVRWWDCKMEHGRKPAEFTLAGYEPSCNVYVLIAFTRRFWCTSWTTGHSALEC